MALVQVVHPVLRNDHESVTRYIHYVLDGPLSEILLAGTRRGGNVRRRETEGPEVIHAIADLL